MARPTLALLACAMLIFQSGLPNRAKDTVIPASGETDSANAAVEPRPALQTQVSAKTPLTLEAAISIARKNYSSILASLAQIAAAQGSLAKTAYLPRSDSFWQTNMHHLKECG